MRRLSLLALLVMGCQDHFISARTFELAQKTCENHDGLLGIQTKADTCYLAIICKNWMATSFDNCIEDQLRR